MNEHVLQYPQVEKGVERHVKVTIDLQCSECFEGKLHEEDELSSCAIPSAANMYALQQLIVKLLGTQTVIAQQEVSKEAEAVRVAQTNMYVNTKLMQQLVQLAQQQNALSVEILAELRKANFVDALWSTSM